RLFLMRVQKMLVFEKHITNTYGWASRDDKETQKHKGTKAQRKPARNDSLLPPFFVPLCLCASVSPVRSPMKPISAIIFKDVAIELRNKESLASMIMFGLLVLVVFNFAFESTGLDKALVAPGTLWVAISFAAILGLNRSFAMETDNDCLQGL